MPRILGICFDSIDDVVHNVAIAASLGLANTVHRTQVHSIKSSILDAGFNRTSAKQQAIFHLLVYNQQSLKNPVNTLRLNQSAAYTDAASAEQFHLNVAARQEPHMQNAQSHFKVSATDHTACSPELHSTPKEFLPGSSMPLHTTLFKASRRKYPTRGSATGCCYLWQTHAAQHCCSAWPCSAFAY